MMDIANTLHPVVLQVPLQDRGLRGPQKVAALRAHARRALHLSAQYSGLILGPLEKDALGAPIPSNGVHWSLSHKQDYVAAVAAGAPVGIDIETIRPFQQGLYERLAGPSEWALAPTVDELLFFRYWTAKEAVLKVVGKGMTGLSDCRVARILDETRLLVHFRETAWTVTHFAIGSQHLAAMTVDEGTGRQLCWHVLNDSTD